MTLAVRLEHAVPGFVLDAQWEIDDELAVLFGHSGSGKSMTLRMLAGLVRPDAGRIVSDGEALFDSEAKVFVPARKRAFGYVTQECTLFPHMTVRGNLEYALRGLTTAERASRIEEAVEAFQLEELLAKRPEHLSGGQKQRIQLARAVVIRPQALLLDEPFSALDAPVREEMREVVRRTHERFAMPIVLVTHDLYEAYTMASTMVVYAGGRSVRAGSPCDIVRDPGAPEVEHLLRSERLFLL